MPIEIKRLDIKAALQFVSEWLTYEKTLRLAGVFFLAEALSVSFALLLAIVVLSAVSSFGMSDVVGEFIASIQPPAATAVPTLTDLAISTIVSLLVVLVAIATLLYSQKWHMEKVFHYTLSKIFPIRFAVSAIPPIGVLIVVLLIPLDPSLILPLAVALLIAAVMAIAVFGWAYVTSFFFTAKMLESIGRKTVFTEINLSNFLAYARFLLTAIFIMLFNILNPRVLYIQVAAVMLTAVAFVFSSSVPQLSMLLWLTIPAYLATIIYNVIRFKPAGIVRILETDSALDALRRAWSYTQGYAFPIAIILILLALSIFVITLLISVLPFILEFISDNVPFLVPVAVSVRVLAEAFGAIVVLLSAALVDLAIYFLLISDLLAKKPRKAAQ